MPRQLIDIWVIEARLGGGGMGTVYRCHNRDAQRIKAAIKVLAPRLSVSGEVRRRFIREAELLFELDHPNIVKVRNIRMDAEPPFIEMVFVEGASLQDHMERGPMAPGAAAHLVGQVASALEHCHSRNVRHRDVKPSNILIKSNHATLVDFGIAAEANGTITQGGGTVGTLSYTPPEWGDTDADSRLWDTYSLGVVFYELLTGQMAFPARTGASLREEMFRLINAKQQISHLDPGEGHPELLRDLIRQLTATDPAGRPTDLGDVSEQLERFAAWRDDLRIEDIESPAPEPGPDLDPPDDTIRMPILAEDAEAPPPTQRPSSDTFDEFGIDTPPATATPARQATSPRPVSIRRVGALTAIAALAGYVAMADPFGLNPSAIDAPTTTGRMTRLAHIQVSGDDLGLPVELRIDGKVLEAGARPSLTIAPHQLEVRLGSGCPDDRPSECLTTSREVSVVDGPSYQNLGITLPTPPDKALSFDPVLPKEAEVRINDGEWTRPEAAVVRGGTTSTVAARVGPCPGSTCREGSVEVTPPLNPDGPVVAAITLPSSATRTATRAAPEGHLVTVGDMAQFLEKNPRFHREAMIAATQAPELYLKGWTGATPPPGEPSRGSAKSATPLLAKAVCAGRGGLYPVDKPPLTWEYDHRTKIMVEFRLGSKGVALLQDNGQVLPPDDRYTSSGFAIRCVR